MELAFTMLEWGTLPVHFSLVFARYLRYLINKSTYFDIIIDGLPGSNKVAISFLSSHNELETRG